MHLYTEAKELAQEAIKEACNDFNDARDKLIDMCDMHEVVIYHGKAIAFCAEQNTSEGEAWLEDCGGITKEGDTFGKIAARVAFATLYCAACDALAEIEQEQEETENDLV
jgi:hypothetical protein